MSSERPRPKITEEATRILRAAAKVAEQRIKERFPEKRRLSKKTARAGG
jgi:division protein CdvB (Snf7/Vps24/ESCRT-III family)